MTLLQPADGSGSISLSEVPRVLAVAGGLQLSRLAKGARRVAYQQIRPVLDDAK
jgi:hypothetical protein